MDTTEVCQELNSMRGGNSYRRIVTRSEQDGYRYTYTVGSELFTEDALPPLSRDQRMFRVGWLNSYDSIDIVEAFDDK